MFPRRLTVRPDLDQLRHQAKDLLRALRRGDVEGLAELREHHPNPPPADTVKLADAQLALARSYGASSWPRLVLSCELIDAIWNDDADAVRRMVLEHPNLLHENAGIRNENWGPPLSYAANIGRNRIIAMLHELGATDLEQGIGRAVLQSRMETAHMLHRLLGSPRPPIGELGGPAYTLSVAGTEFLFSIGAEMVDQGGHTALFGAVVSYPHFWMNFTGGWASSRKPANADFAQLLLDAGADPNSRASFREPVESFIPNHTRDHRDITPLGWGQRFSNRMVVSEPAMRLLAARGGEV